ncbi:MAG: hypothetical protein AB1634_19180, partial [Thermodesulfobacteriota bacterium]
NGRLLVGDGQAIFSCDLDARRCEPVDLAPGTSIRENYKLAYHKAKDILYVADTNNHALIAKALGTSGSRDLSGVKLSYPNDMTMSRQGALLIADTKNSRITEDNRICAIYPANGRIEVFGDERLQGILAETRQQRDAYRTIKGHSFTLLGLTLAGLVVMLLVHKRSQAAKLAAR